MLGIYGCCLYCNNGFGDVEYVRGGVCGDGIWKELIVVGDVELYIEFLFGVYFVIWECL